MMISGKKSARMVAIIAVACALLIAIQYVFSAVKGIELVSVFFVAFCFAFGSIAGMALAVAFSLLRCLLFGFFPQVMILYLVNYLTFALLAGLVGRLVKEKKQLTVLFSAVAVATFFALFLTAADDVITPLFFRYDAGSAQAYFYASIPVALLNAACALVSTGVLFLPLYKVFYKVSLSVGR